MTDVAADVFELLEVRRGLLLTPLPRAVAATAPPPPPAAPCAMAAVHALLPRVRDGLPATPPPGRLPGGGRRGRAHHHGDGGEGAQGVGSIVGRCTESPPSFPLPIAQVRDEAVLFIWEAFTTPVAKAK